MVIELRLLEDTLPAGSRTTLRTAAPRAIYVAAGSVHVDGIEFAADNGTVTRAASTFTAGKHGACLWRWEIAQAPDEVETIGAQTLVKMCSPIFDADISATHLLRLDSVAFPPGGCAYLHTHQGPGTRCLIEGSIRIDTEGHSTSYGPGSPWYEAGPDPVFAQADAEIATRFIRALVLPKALLGQSSIHYVNEEDRAKPKSQTYRVFDEHLLG